MNRTEGVSPYENVVSAASRFAIELAAWTAGPWAVAGVSIWLAIPAAIILITLPGVFSTTGDKKRVFVATPGPVRVGIEVLLHVVAVAGAWIAWPTAFAIGVSVVAAVSVVAGVPRTRWLLRGAPLPS